MGSEKFKEGISDQRVEVRGVFFFFVVVVFYGEKKKGGV